jgi:hypothetical protein
MELYEEIMYEMGKEAKNLEEKNDVDEKAIGC